MSRPRLRLCPILVVLALAAWLPAAGAADVAALMPLRRRPAGAVPAGQCRLRGDVTLLMYAPQKGAELALRVRARQVGRYDAEVLAHPLAGGDVRLSLRPTAEQREPAGVLRFRAARRGVAVVRLITGANSASVAATGRCAWVAAEAPARSPLHVISRVDRLYFFVPRSARAFTVFGRGSALRENVRVHVFDPSGKCVGQASAKGTRIAAVPVRPSEAQRGKVWSLRADRPPDLDGTFEDADIWLAGDVPPYVSPQADGLLVPFIDGLSRRPIARRGQNVTLSFHLNVEAPPAATLRLAPTQPGSPFAPTGPAAASEPVRLTVGRNVAAGRHGLRAELLDGNTPLAAASFPITTTPRLVFVGRPQPLIHLELVKGGQGRAAPPGVAVRPAVTGLGEPIAADVRLLRTAIPDPPGGASARQVLKEHLSPLADEPRRIPAPSRLADGHYQWKVVARAGGEVVDVACAHFLLKGEKLFSEVPPPPGGPVPALTADEQRRGFVGFVPDAVDAIAWNHRPSRRQIDRPVLIELARDEYEPGTFGLWAARSVRGLKVSVTPPRHEESGATLDLDVRVARYWPQRLSWNTETYRIIPEMLEPAGAFDLVLDEVRQVWLTVHAPPQARPGRYRGRITVRSADGGEWTVPLEVRVLGFLLARPTGVHWGLYSDSARWRRYKDAQVRAELADVAAHGITTLMCYPLAHAKVSPPDDGVRIDDAEFFRYMKLARRAGLRGPWVMSLQPLSGMVRRMLPGKTVADAEFKKRFQQIAGQFARRAREERLGECVWHTLDEPWRPEQVRQAAAELGSLKEISLTTFTTAGLVPPPLDAVLDVRCYPRSQLLASPAVLAEQARRTADGGDRLWWYGSGCYTGQEGNVYTNRFLTGFLFWRSGAEGQWSWTFLRTKGDALDDFDGTGRREAKDACIVYPSTTGGEPTPTLQWEGIREGIDDYRYAWTLRQALGRRAPADGASGPMACLRAVPVTPRAGRFSAADAQRLRREIVRRIEAAVRDPKGANAADPQ